MEMVVKVKSRKEMVYVYIAPYEHEGHYKYSTVQYSQGPWYSTVQYGVSAVHNNKYYY